jgi:hypothetical protein
MSENGSNNTGEQDAVVVRKAERGWVVGEENVSDLVPPPAVSAPAGRPGRPW